MFIEKKDSLNVSYGCWRNTKRISSTSYAEYPDSYTGVSELTVSKADSLKQKGET